MNKNKRLGGKLGIVLCTALLGTLINETSYGQPSVAVGVSVSLPSVEIRSASDFYEPLAPQGEWVVVGSYGRCWRPGHVARDWRPYCSGNWEMTDAGWYWVSDEPWAWATYHYGRWNLSAEFGWYWVPQTEWAPAWVSWHSGGGYIGWAPMYPSGVVVIAPQAYVFVEERHFMEPVSRSTIVVNNTTIINKTVINQAPAPAAIERVSGRKIQAVPVQELRHKQEAAVVTRQKAPEATGVKNVQTPVRRETQPAETKAVTAHESPQVQKPATATHESAAPAPKNDKVRSETRQPIPAAAEPRPAARAETRPEVKVAPKPEANHPAAATEPKQPKADKEPVKKEKSAPPSDQQAQPPAQVNPAASDNNGANPADNGHDKKNKD